MTIDYHGPCLILLDRSTTVEVRRGGRVESVSMPRVEPPHDEPSGRHVKDSNSRNQR
jgi:hypothetical protein